MQLGGMQGGNNQQGGLKPMGLEGPRGLADFGQKGNTKIDYGQVPDGMHDEVASAQREYLHQREALQSRIDNTDDPQKRIALKKKLNGLDEKFEGFVDDVESLNSSKGRKILASNPGQRQTTGEVRGEVNDFLTELQAFDKQNATPKPKQSNGQKMEPSVLDQIQQNFGKWQINVDKSLPNKDPGKLADWKADNPGHYDSTVQQATGGAEGESERIDQMLEQLQDLIQELTDAFNTREQATDDVHHCCRNGLRM